MQAGKIVYERRNISPNDVSAVFSADLECVGIGDYEFPAITWTNVIDPKLLMYVRTLSLSVYSEILGLPVLPAV